MKRAKWYKKAIHERPLIARYCSYLPDGRIEQDWVWKDIDLRLPDTAQTWRNIHFCNSGLLPESKTRLVDRGLLTKVTIEHGLTFLPAKLMVGGANGNPSASALCERAHEIINKSSAD